MSLTIYYEPIDVKHRCFNYGTSDDFKLLRETFLSETITPDDLRTLNAMWKASGNKFFDEVATIVENIGAIKIWGEY